MRKSAAGADWASAGGPDATVVVVFAVRQPALDNARAAGMEVLERYDHVEVALDLHDALPTGESLEGFLDGLGG